VTGLTSNPTIFEHAIRSNGCYDDAVREKTLAGKSGEELFFELALEDLCRAADLLRPVHEATGGIDGWVSLEVSPLLSDDTVRTVEAARQLHARARGSPVRSAFTRGVRSALEMLTRLSPGKSERARRKRALATYASMIGALVLARAVDDPELSEEVLRSVRASIADADHDNPDAID
jgi:hypothetical protein